MDEAARKAKSLIGLAVGMNANDASLQGLIAAALREAEERGRREERERITRFIREIDGSTHPMDVASAIERLSDD